MTFEKGLVPETQGPLIHPVEPYDGANPTEKDAMPPTHASKRLVAASKGGGS
jgi:hypothetical protein